MTNHARNLFLLLALLCAPRAAFAEGGMTSGGGGIGVLCNGKLQALDLYEGEVVRGLHPQKGPKTFAASMEYYIRLFAQKPRAAAEQTFDPGILKEMKKFMRQKIRFVNEELPPTRDATLPTLKPGCKTVQIATQSGKNNSVFSEVYENSVKIKINRKLWDKLDARNKAAVMMHEFIYAIRRSGFNPAPKSDDSRKNVIGIFFQGSEPLLKDIWDSREHQLCMATYRMPSTTPAGDQYSESFKQAEWLVAESVQNGVRGLLFNFTRIGEEELASRTTMFVPGLTLKSYQDGTVPMEGEVSQSFDGRKWTFRSQRNEDEGSGKDTLSGGKGWFKLKMESKDGAPMPNGDHQIYGRCVEIGEDFPAHESGLVKRRKALREEEARKKEAPEASENSTIGAE